MMVSSSRMSVPRIVSSERRSSLLDPVVKFILRRRRPRDACLAECGEEAEEEQMEYGLVGLGGKGD